MENFKCSWDYHNLTLASQILKHSQFTSVMQFVFNCLFFGHPIRVLGLELYIWEINYNGGSHDINPLHHTTKWRTGLIQCKQMKSWVYWLGQVSWEDFFFFFDSVKAFNLYAVPQKQYADAVIQVLPTQLIPDEQEGKILRVRMVMKEGVEYFEPVHPFDDGSTISWVPCGRKLTCSYPGIKLFYGPETYYASEVIDHPKPYYSLSLPGWLGRVTFLPTPSCHRKYP